MRKLLNIISLATLFLLVGFQQKSAASPALQFYIVSEEKIDGGQFIDTPDLPKLGYISSVPVLTITNLESVDLGSPKPQIMLDENRKVVSSNSVSSLNISLNSDDAKKFSAITEQAIGKQLLMMLDNSPLIAPRINGPISTKQIQLTLGDQTKLQKVQDKLKELVH